MFSKQLKSSSQRKTHVIQWRNTKSIIEWCKAIKNKSNGSYIKFDIVGFYPSISKELYPSISFRKKL